MEVCLPRAARGMAQDRHWAFPKDSDRGAGVCKGEEGRLSPWSMQTKLEGSG